MCCFMYRKSRKMVLAFCVVLLVFVEVSMIWLMKNSLSKNNIPNILTEENIITNNMFAIMLEQSDGSYAESSKTTWPTDMIYNDEKSGCVDNYGNIIENALAFDTSSNTATVYTETTGNCYLYFDLSSN